MPPTTRRTLALCVAVSGLLLASCTLSPDGERVTPTPTPPPPVYTAELRLPGDAATILAGDDDVTIAAAASSAMFTSAPVAVVAPSGDVDSQLRGASIAVALGAPLLLISTDPILEPGAAPSADPGAEPPATDPATDPGAPPADGVTPTPSAPDPNDLALEELARLGVLAVLTVGDVTVDATEVFPVPDDDAALAELIRIALPVAPLAAGAEEGWSDVDVVAALDRDAPQLLVVEPVPVPSESPPATSGPTDEATGEPSDGATQVPVEDTSPLPHTTLAEPIAGGLLLTTGDVTDLGAVADRKSVV